MKHGPGIYVRPLKENEYFVVGNKRNKDHSFVVIKASDFYRLLPTGERGILGVLLDEVKFSVSDRARRIRSFRKRENVRRVPTEVSNR